MKHLAREVTWPLNLKSSSILRFSSAASAAFASFSLSAAFLFQGFRAAVYGVAFRHLDPKPYSQENMTKLTAGSPDKRGCVLSASALLFS